jgi:hypothetical protein
MFSRRQFITTGLGGMASRRWEFSMWAQTPPTWRAHTAHPRLSSARQGRLWWIIALLDGVTRRPLGEELSPTPLAEVISAAGVAGFVHRLRGRALHPFLVVAGSAAS